MVLGFFLLGSTFLGCGDKPEAAVSAVPLASAASDLAPDFKVTRINGETFSLSAHKGKVVLIDFWATWCPPCIAEIPHFNELYAAYKPRGFEMIGLSVDQGGRKVVEPFVVSRGVTYPVAMADDALVDAYGGIRGLPTSFLIDKQGRIAEKFLGYREKQVFEAAIKRLLAEQN